jgi:excisionase family DNA binding protein
MRAQSKERPPADAVPEFITSDEVARILRVQPRQVQRLVRLGRLNAAAKPGARLLFRRQDVETYLTGGAKPNTRVVMEPV